ncbi:uncharacterized protein MONBRDRAFT_35292 [Monosiga brevicollis MX1]|uniref:small monomeric GTPase n=1 Tax=Monosiga brevicollis TaxID=81824 RepID=A9VA76_MONBE|nr:uncharacterized protein MONBRDRAFT_35292 [Monosiga brevicollis MX1]EDQ85617.1 predicted protein [Monosiga brevicollis MX1]|eukprot:XP_001749566.1 hypothetical protein [Monosiga brevicollis MX1]
MASKDGLLKVVILGDGGVGKSSLMARFVNNTFDEHNYHTIGVEFLNKDIIVDNKTCHLQIWDTAGQERYKALRRPFYRGSDCCMFVFDLTDRHTFDHLDAWISEFKEFAEVEDPDNFPFLLVGNKVDVEGRQVAHAQALDFCKGHHDMPYYETSAKTAENVEEAFLTAVRLLMANQVNVKAKFTDTVDLKAKERAQGCC